LKIVKLHETAARFALKTTMRLFDKVDEGFQGWDDPDYLKDIANRMLNKAAKINLCVSDQSPVNEKDLLDLSTFAMFIWDCIQEKDKANI